MPRPHYRGAPAIWTDSYAAELLSPQARVSSRSRIGASAARQAAWSSSTRSLTTSHSRFASIIMFAGPVLFRVAAHLDAERGFERVSQERNRFQQMVDSLPDPVVITDASNDIMVQNKRAEHLLFITEDDSPGRRRAVELNNLFFSSFLSRATIARHDLGRVARVESRRPGRRPRPAVRGAHPPARRTRRAGRLGAVGAARRHRPASRRA